MAQVLSNKPPSETYDAEFAVGQVKVGVQPFKDPVKIFNRAFCHHGLKYKLPGINHDTEKFDPTGTCRAGGIYFTDKSKIMSFLDFGPYIANVDVLPESKVYYEAEGYFEKAKTDIISVSEPILVANLPMWETITAADIVSAPIPGYAFLYAHKTLELCKKILHQNPNLFPFVPESFIPDLLDYIPKQYIMCIPRELLTEQYILHRFSITGSSLLLEDLDPALQTPAICNAAIKVSPALIKRVRQDLLTDTIVDIVCARAPWLLCDLPDAERIINSAISREAYIISYRSIVKFRSTADLIWQKYREISMIPRELLTLEICLAAVKDNPENLYLTYKYYKECLDYLRANPTDELREIFKATSTSEVLDRHVIFLPMEMWTVLDVKRNPYIDSLHIELPDKLASDILDSKFASGIIRIIPRKFWNPKILERVAAEYGLYYIDDEYQTPRLVEIAITIDVSNIKHVAAPLKQHAIDFIYANGLARKIYDIRSIPEEYRTKEIIDDFLANQTCTISYLEQTPELCKRAMLLNSRSLQFIKDEFKTLGMCVAAVFEDIRFMADTSPRFWPELRRILKGE